MDRTERFYRIDLILKQRHAVPFATLQEALGVSRPQLKRNIAYMPPRERRRQTRS